MHIIMPFSFFMRGATLATLSGSSPLEEHRRDPRRNAGRHGSKENGAGAKGRRKAVERKDKSARGKGNIAQKSERFEPTTNRALFPGEDHAAYAALHDEL